MGFGLGLGGKRALPTVTEGATADEVNLDYFEAQIGWQCGVHATNNAFGEAILTVAAMALLIDRGKAGERSGSTGLPPSWFVDRNDVTLRAPKSERTPTTS